MTRRAALSGNPLMGRHSQVMHNAAFDHFGIDARYELLELEPEEVPAFVAGARDDAWLGFQVTMPHKQLVMDHLDEIEVEARQIGAVNSVLRGDDGTLVGFNTDAPGFQRAVEAELDIRFEGIRAAVAGAGGAARAVVHALVSDGADEVRSCNRNPSRAQNLAADIGGQVHAVDLGSEFENSLARADLAVNATIGGMIEHGTPCDGAARSEAAAVYDLIYDPPESELLAAASARGLRTANGLGMLVGQAEIAFERWTGVTDAGPVMRTSLVPPGPTA